MGVLFSRSWLLSRRKTRQNQERPPSATWGARVNRRCRLFRESCDHGRAAGRTLRRYQFHGRAVFGLLGGWQLVEERVFSNIGEALKRIRPDLPRYLNPPNWD